MSQAGDIDVIGNNPSIATTFVTDDGDAIPILNTLEILGTAVAAGSIPVETTGSGNTVTIEVQRTQAIAGTDATKVGLAAFDSASFAVDGNGFVTLAGGGLAIDSIGTQTGTNPIVPTAGGLVTINGAVVAAGTNPVRSDGTGANTMAIEVQISQAIASTNASNIGLAAFDSASFSVDANGFVTLKGGTEAIDSIGVDATSGAGTNPVLPDSAGLVTVNGALVAASTTPVRTVSTAANVYQIQVQTSQAIAATNATKVGLANFNSAQFSVDANGFVSMVVGVFTWTDVTTATQAMAVQNGYITDRGAGVVYTLPATAALGDEMKVVGKLGLTTITPNANQQILMGSGSGTVGVTGTIVGTNLGDCVTLRVITAGASTVWRAESWVGNWTIS